MLTAGNIFEGTPGLDIVKHEVGEEFGPHLDETPVGPAVSSRERGSPTFDYQLSSTAHSRTIAESYRLMPRPWSWSRPRSRRSWWSKWWSRPSCCAAWARVLAASCQSWRSGVVVVVGLGAEGLVVVGDVPDVAVLADGGDGVVPDGGAARGGGRVGGRGCGRPSGVAGLCAALRVRAVRSRSRAAARPAAWRVFGFVAGEPLACVVEVVGWRRRGRRWVVSTSRAGVGELAVGGPVDGFELGSAACRRTAATG